MTTHPDKFPLVLQCRRFVQRVQHSELLQAACWGVVFWVWLMVALILVLA